MKKTTTEDPRPVMSEKVWRGLEHFVRQQEPPEDRMKRPVDAEDIKAAVFWIKGMRRYYRAAE